MDNVSEVFPCVVKERPLQKTVQGQSFELVFHSNSNGVRMALRDVVDHLEAAKIPNLSIDEIELALAEVLNNIVEHAYDFDDAGVIILRLKVDTPKVYWQVIDEGGEMPKEGLPPGHLVDLGTSLHSLPEGGFGWFIIRKLVQDIHYKRVEGKNILSFISSTEQRANASSIGAT